MVFGNSWGTDGHMLRYASRGGGFALMVNAPKKQRKTIRKYGVKLQSFPAPR
jgi:hypothetical protein